MSDSKAWLQIKMTLFWILETLMVVHFYLFVVNKNRHA